MTTSGTIGLLEQVLEQLKILNEGVAKLERQVQSLEGQPLCNAHVKDLFEEDRPAMVPTSTPPSIPEPADVSPPRAEYKVESSLPITVKSSHVVSVSDPQSEPVIQLASVARTASPTFAAASRLSATSFARKQLPQIYCPMAQKASTSTLLYSRMVADCCKAAQMNQFVFKPGLY